MHFYLGDWDLLNTLSRKAVAGTEGFHPQLILHFLLYFLIYVWTSVPVIGSVFINLPSICLFVSSPSTYKQQKDVSEFCSYSKYRWAMISWKSLMTIFKTATTFHINSVIVIATNSLQMCICHGWGDPGDVNLVFFLSRNQGTVIVTETYISVPNPYSSSSMVIGTIWF